MCNMKVRSIVLCGFTAILILVSNSGKAQTLSIDSLLIKAMETDELLPRLIDSAIKYSPIVRRMTNSISLADEGLQISKKNIYSSFLSGVVALAPVIDNRCPNFVRLVCK